MVSKGCASSIFCANELLTPRTADKPMRTASPLVEEALSTKDADACEALMHGVSTSTP